MTSPLLPSLRAPSCRIAALVLVLSAACSDRAVGPAIRTLDDAALNASPSAGDASCSKKEMTVDVHAFLESDGSVTIEATSPAGTSIEKIKVKLYDLRGKHAGEAEFNKIPANTGSASVSIPTSKGVQQDWKAVVTVHVRGCRGKESEAVRAEAIVTRRFDLSVTPILMAEDHSEPQDAQLGVANLYDVTVSNAGGLDVEASCNVFVDGIPEPAANQLWVDGEGNQIGDSGQPILILAGEAQVCRFSVTYAAEGPRTLMVSTAAVGGGEINLANNSTTATITVLPGGNAPLVTYEWVLRQREGVNVAEDGTETSTGIVSQSATIHTYFEEAVSDAPGTDRWEFTATSSTNGVPFDSKTAIVDDAPRITRAMIEALGPDGQVCQPLTARSPSTTRSYLFNAITVCARIKPGDLSTAIIRFSYVASSNVFDPPYNPPDLLLWGPTFSYFTEITHTGAADPKTYGGLTKSVDLPPPQFESGLPVLGANVRLTAYP